jgi:transcriptional regulator with XRE-family HTH domain
MTTQRKRWPEGAWMRLTSQDTLRALMDQREFSYERLARYAGCSKSFISHLAKGRKTTCTPRLAENIAEALDVPLGLLFVDSMSTASRQNIDRESAA